MTQDRTPVYIGSRNGIPRGARGRLERAAYQHAAIFLEELRQFDGSDADAIVVILQGLAEVRIKPGIIAERIGVDVRRLKAFWLAKERMPAALQLRAVSAMREILEARINNAPRWVFEEDPVRKEAEILKIQRQAATS